MRDLLYSTQKDIGKDLVVCVYDSSVCGAGNGVVEVVVVSDECFGPDWRCVTCTKWNHIPVA